MENPLYGVLTDYLFKYGLIIQLMPRLFLHRVEPIRKDGTVTLEKVPEVKYNIGVKYKLTIKPLNDNYARAYGWASGDYPMASDEGPQGNIYAPDGFGMGKIVFVDVNDELLSVSQKDNTSIDKFLENLKDADLTQSIDQMQGFSLVGKIE